MVTILHTSMRIYISVILTLQLHLTLAFNKTGNDTKSLRVSGGQKAKSGQFPALVSLRVLFPEEHICGGSILSEKYILSAAQCMFSPVFKTQRPATELVVVAGETKLVDLVDAKRKGFVSKVFVHPDYRTTKDGVIADLAILKLINALKFSKTVQPINLIKNFVGNHILCQVAGWGVNKFGSNNPSKHLKYSEVNRVGLFPCQSQLGLTLPPGTMCAGHGNDTCQGDSGGGLVCEGHLVGMVSYGRGNCRGPTVYTEVGVSIYTEWITVTSGASLKLLNSYFLFLYCVIIFLNVYNIENT